MTEEKLWAGAVGVLVRLRLVDGGETVNPATATARRLYITRGDGTVVARENVGVGVTRSGHACLEYSTQAGDLVPGPVTFSGWLQDGARQLPAESITRLVLPHPSYTP